MGFTHRSRVGYPACRTGRATAAWRFWEECPVAGPSIELTRRAAAGRRQVASELALLVVHQVRAQMDGRPAAEVRARLIQALSEEALALTPGSLESCVDWITRGGSPSE
jgi:hypothetical protein